MTIRLLGTAAGGGVPQWNCNCPVCREARAGTARVLPRTQSSVAVSADGRRWFLLNASPDIRSQIESFPAIQPPAGKTRGSPIQAVLLTSASELEFWVRTPGVREEVQELAVSQALQEQYWKPTHGAVRTGLERSLELLDAYGEMVQWLMQRFYSGVTRYTTSSFLRVKLGDALTKRNVAPYIYESADEAREHLHELEHKVTP